jgi:dihydrofolate reductase
MTIALIAILDQANGIGRENKLLCHLPADLRRFKQLTTGHCVVMGRKTFESLPNGPLPNRRNIIITRDKEFKQTGIEVIHSVKEIFKVCENEHKIFIIGGGQIYNIMLEYADILYITKIHHTFISDAFFPEIKSEEWEIKEKIDYTADEKNKFDYSFIEFLKKIEINEKNATFLD